MFNPTRPLIYLRYSLALIGVIFIAQTIDLGVQTWAVVASVILGIFSSNYCLKRNISTISLIVGHILLVLLLRILFSLLFSSLNVFDDPYFDLHPDIIKTQIILLISFYLFTFVENSLFWSRRFVLAFEVFGIGLIILNLLSGHRNYKIDMPNAISSLTWKIPALQRFSIEPQVLLVSIAFTFALISVAYIILANSRILINENNRRLVKGQKRRLLEIFIAGCVILGLFYSSKIILSRYESELSQVMNGVGPSNDLSSGKSNLGFNKASHPSKQPAAFVRLQNSYDENPWKPMMYFREGALSTYDGKEIVKSGTGYDTDAPILRPGEPYRGELLDGEPVRSKILQAVYVLSDKITPFGIDAPVQINPIKNPNPKRFRYAYTALSLALTEPLNTLLDLEVGNPNWSQEQREHYLRAPGSKDFEELGKLINPTLQEPILSSNSGEDLRYKALSTTLTSNLLRPVEKAAKIIEYLSKESIYVLEPGHTLGSNGDPVAPYLFPDKKRGYCVHFAHAATYLLRLAGIPARIGTGFLVDLQYAKGGDILVQMGDRHAWSEIYVKDRGWVVFDVTPAQAENQEVPVPDESLLEQLMSEIDPIEELGEPAPILEKEENQKSPIEALLDSPIWGYQKYLLGIIILTFFLFKFLIRNLWRFTFSPPLKIRRSYIATISKLEDFGIGRYFGETRTDYATRLKDTKNIDIVKITNLAVANTYSKKSLDLSDTSIDLKGANAYFNQNLTRRVLAFLSFLNPASIGLVTKLFSRNTLKSLIVFHILFSIASDEASAIPGDENYQTNVEDQNQTLTQDLNKSADELLLEGVELLREGKSIDARAKFEYALNQNPTDHRAYLFLGQYYLTEVSHFKLAYRYLKQARKLFEENSKKDYSSVYDLGFQNQHSLILYLESEAALNLDFYQESLEILDEYEKLYQAEWFPGQKAWVLMKLKRINEAIEVAKTGILNGADPKRTWNILGILLSVSNQRELGLQAFAKAIKYEMTLANIPQVATPVNNAGEVFRELFKDAHAESAWISALKLPDGCDHILPSVNLSILYTDQLRLFQAEQVLSDFEACFAQKPEKKDSEHRTILALARAKIKLLSNDITAALALSTIASDDQQWFGKIGTNENDVKFSSWMILALTEDMNSMALADEVTDSHTKSMLNLLNSKKSKIYSWWLKRKAKIFAVKNLDDFEDLFIRHTDTMITYPLLGAILEQFDYSSLKKRIDRMLVTDSRDGAKNYYEFYLAKKLVHDGEQTEAITILENLLTRLPEHERLLKAEILATMISAKINQGYFFQKSRLILENKSRIIELYKLLPSYIRSYNLALPVTIEVAKNLNPLFKDLKPYILESRFLNVPAEDTEYRLAISNGDKSNAFVQLYEKSSNRKISEVEIPSVKEIPTKLNEFIKLSFAHRIDPIGMQLPDIPFVRGQ